MRRLSKAFKLFIEAKIHRFCPVREITYNFRPGFVYPTRNSKVIQLPNIVHVYLYHYFPDYNQWVFNYILNREFHLHIDTLNHRRTTFCYNLFKYKKIKHLELKNLSIVGFYFNGIIAGAENITLRNVVFCKMFPEMSKSECKNLYMEECSNLQHLYNSRFFNAHTVKVVRSDVVRETFKIFSGDALTSLTINYNYSFDDDAVRYLTIESPFCRITHLDLGHNILSFQGLCHIMSGSNTFGSTLEWLGVECNKIVASLP